MTNAQVDEAMAAIDKDGNGTIDYDEFVMWWDNDEKDIGDSSRRLKAAIMAREAKRQMSKHFESLKSSGYTRDPSDTRHSYKADIALGDRGEEKSTLDVSFSGNTEADAKADFEKLGAPEGTKAAFWIDFCLQGISVSRV